MLNLKPAFQKYSLLICFFFAANISITACSCDYNGNFCSAVLSGTQIFLVEAKSIISPSQRGFRVIEEIMGTSISQNIIVKGQDGVNCLEQLHYFEVGDTAVMVLFLDSTMEDDYLLNGCTKSFLEYKNGNVIGTMVPGTDVSTYAEFLSNLPNCIDFISSTKAESILGASLNIYPNPSSDLLNIHLTDHIINGFQIRSLDGSLLMNQNGIKSDHLKIDISTLPVGVYVISINSYEGIISRKVVLI